MALPKSINLMGHKIKVILNDDPDNHGTCDVNLRIIWIRGSDSASTQQETLIHECAHMILGLSGVSQLLSEELEEAIVVAIETGFSPLINTLSKGK